MLTQADRTFAAAFIGIPLLIVAGDPRTDQLIGLAEEVLPRVNRTEPLIAPLVVHFAEVGFIRHWVTREQQIKRMRWLEDAREIAATYLLHAAATGFAALRGEKG